MQALYHAYWEHSGAERALNRALLDRFRLDGRRYGFRPVVMFIPGRSDTPHDRERRLWLRQYCDGNGVPYLDLTDALHAAGVEQVYARNNPHWNEAGHRLAAERLRQLLSVTLGRR